MFSNEIFLPLKKVFISMPTGYLKLAAARPSSAKSIQFLRFRTIKGEPEQFLENASVMASLLKSEKLELDAKEVKYTLDAQIKYAKNDLAIIDWDGAFLFDPSGDIEEEIELLTLANLQLLRHRILDRQLDQRLTRMVKMTPAKKRFTIKN